MSETPQTAEKERCCACTSEAAAYVIDGAHRKPVCESHGRMYRQQGYKITGYDLRNPAAKTSDAKEAR